MDNLKFGPNSNLPALMLEVVLQKLIRIKYRERIATDSRAPLILYDIVSDFCKLRKRRGERLYV
jgi:hypothetical protein